MPEDGFTVSMLVAADPCAAFDVFTNDIDRMVDKSTLQERVGDAYRID